MRLLSFALLVSLAAMPAPAQTSDQPSMNAESFDTYTLGRTLSYSMQGTPYGIEEYLPGRRVRWAFVGQECQTGVWFERNGNICFIYDNAPTDEQCWRFYASQGGLRGVFQGPDGPTTELYEVQQSDQPLTCAGPGLGV